MNSDEKIKDLLSRQEKAYADSAKARKRMEDILDPQSFTEVGLFADEVLTGYGTINGRLCYIYSQNPNCVGGAVGTMAAKKISHLYSLALKMGAPVIGILDSKGLKLSEGIDALSAYGEIYGAMSRASGVVPQITFVAGNCLGGSVFIAQMSDFVFMHKGSNLFITSPQTMDNQQKDSTIMADYIGETPEEVCQKIIELITYLPSNNMEEGYLTFVEDDLNRTDDALNNFIADRKSVVPIKDLITVVSDRNQFFEVKKDSAKGIVTGFASFNGYSVGIIANNNQHETKLTTQSVKKASYFAKFCDAFNIPILTFTDTTGFTHNYDEAQGLSEAVSELIHSFASATVPKVNVIVKNAFGSAFLAFNSKSVGADIVYAWATSSIGVAEPEAAVSVLYPQMWTIGEMSKEDAIDKYAAESLSPYTAAEKGHIDDVIVPAQTRKYIVAAFEMLSGKRTSTVLRKRSSL